MGTRLESLCRGRTGGFGENSTLYWEQPSSRSPVVSGAWLCTPQLRQLSVVVGEGIKLLCLIGMGDLTPKVCSVGPLQMMVLPTLISHWFLLQQRGQPSDLGDRKYKHPHF